MGVVRNDSAHPLPEPFSTDADGWDRRERLNKSEAEQLLDWLQANGYLQREVSYSETTGFTVRWHR
jgi:hypothetical protein